MCDCPNCGCDDDWDEDDLEFCPGEIETYDGVLLDHRGQPLEKPPFRVGFHSPRF